MVWPMSGTVLVPDSYDNMSPSHDALTARRRQSKAIPRSVRRYRHRWTPTPVGHGRAPRQ
jgi:hypothetical protein